MNVHFFNSIPVIPPSKEIFSRLGQVQGITRITAARRAEVERYISEASALVELRGAALRCNIRSEGETVTIASENNPVLKSAALANLLDGCAEMVMFAATAGETIVNAIARDVLGSDVTRAVVFDAVASEMTDAGLDWIMRYWNQELRRENKTLTKRRMSAGYGDFLLENQKIFHALLDLNCLGVTITPQYILVPEKSVTGVAGILSVQGE